MSVRRLTSLWVHTLLRSSHDRVDMQSFDAIQVFDPLTKEKTLQQQEEADIRRHMHMSRDSTVKLKHILYSNSRRWIWTVWILTVCWAHRRLRLGPDTNWGERFCWVPVFLLVNKRHVDSELVYRTESPGDLTSLWQQKWKRDSKKSSSLLCYLTSCSNGQSLIINKWTKARTQLVPHEYRLNR